MKRLIEAMVTARMMARKRGDYATADWLRDLLRDTFTIELEDHTTGCYWRAIRPLYMGCAYGDGWILETA